MTQKVSSSISTVSPTTVQDMPDFKHQLHLEVKCSFGEILQRLREISNRSLTSQTTSFFSESCIFLITATAETLGHWAIISQLVAHHLSIK